MRDHRRLKVFQLTDRLVLLAYKHTGSFPPHEQFGLTSQIRRAAVSSAANIVEGAARHSSADFRRLLLIAYGSVRELEYHVSLAARLGYMAPVATAQIEDLASQSGRALRALIEKIR
ncbi:four helix bundle protein [Povalibacter uvarum]|uniref:Four helix bundle protein n=1 Tax=Povalibacter uvarum TaxID=732238 RepID=A0A841HRT6_9GAMM|nr:four helix bundle protein [Povalibacter uvarum]MBB6094930.1 four helix bundle protein [Povalibacter uvarum]